MFEHVEKIMQSCSCGRRHSLMTEECVVSRDAIPLMKEYIARKGYRRPAVVADGNTRIFADAILREIPAGLTVVAGDAHATEVWTARVGAFVDAEKPDALIACGSGSVHDITRYVACEKKIPFISYPTAASVDGFVSGVAAMTWYGQKLTFPSVSPVAAFADPEVFSSAPARLTASGVGDVLANMSPSSTGAWDRSSRGNISARSCALWRRKPSGNCWRPFGAAGKSGRPPTARRS